MAPTHRLIWPRIGLPRRSPTYSHSPTVSEQQPCMGTLLFSGQVAMHLHQPHLDIHRSGHLQYPCIHSTTHTYPHLKHRQGAHPSMRSPMSRHANLLQFFTLAKNFMLIQSTNPPRGHLLLPQMVTSNHLDLRITLPQAHWTVEKY